ncbi:STE24 endopeptidase [Brevundimonas vesicularis]|uniref:STE24 endopeptidase n=1 Tax=Brevundimonas vesicularis TaxID=41276 RepID=A0A7W9FRM8_BREVE|nr:M48 family metallopeptidase [Brevundimonas vesicularis]MBB5770253.1 STE24 endopeptidase [Brevundimonas vesicularis]
MHPVPFDAARETARYLATVSQADVARAVAYTQGSHWLLVWDALISFVICLLIVRLGLLVRLAGHLQSTRQRPNLVAFLSAALFTIVRWALEAPWSAYADWGRERAYGFTRQPFYDWLGQGLIEAVISSVFGGIFFVLLYGLIRRTGRWWPAWGTALATAFSFAALVIAPIFVAPAFNHYTPAPAGPVRDAVETLAREDGGKAPSIRVYDGSRQSNRFTATVVGIGDSARIAMSDAMLQQGVGVEEVQAVVGHEIGHYRYGHLIWLATFLSGLFAVGFVLIDRLFPVTARLLGFSGNIADPAGLPVLTALIVALTLLATPLINTVQRTIELQADNYSLAHARLPDALVSALLKTADYRSPSPSGLEEALFYDHPSIARRVRNAMDWKAAHFSLRPERAARDADPNSSPAAATPDRRGVRRSRR